jgi:phage gp36-like protein
MSYCTLAQLIERFSERLLIDISDRGNAPTGSVDTALVQRAIADADAEIDGFLRGRYQLPLPAVPPLLTDLSLRIAIYKAHTHTVTEKIRRDYEDAIRSLKLIADGVIRLDIAGSEPASAGALDVIVTDTARPITVASMKGFI